MATVCPRRAEATGLEGGCSIERLSLDLARRPELAQYLLEIRLGLDRARRRGDEARSLFYRLGR